MEFMPWKDEYSINVSSIDNQHKKLVSLLNQLYKGMMKVETVDIKKVVKDLIEYTVIHFSFEEDIFSKINYSDTENHKKEHQTFIDKASDFQKMLLNGDAKLDAELMIFLKNWLKDHILVTDVKYVEDFKKNGIK